MNNIYTYYEINESARSMAFVKNRFISNGLNNAALEWRSWGIEIKLLFSDISSYQLNGFTKISADFNNKQETKVAIDFPN